MDLLCSGGDIDLGGNFTCELEGDEIVCMLTSPVDALASSEETIVIGAGDQRTEIRCSRDGNTVTCRLPQSVAAKALGLSEQLSAVSPLDCDSGLGIIVCDSEGFAIGEMQTVSFDLIAKQPGVLRNL